MITIVSFDVSSATVGWGVLQIEDNKIKYVNSGFHKPSHEGSIIDRLANTRDEINKIIQTYQPTHIAIEDIIKFMKGKSSANTIITLTSFNRMISLLAFDYLSKSPDLFNVLSIRHGIKLNKIFPKKEDIPELVATHLGITFPYVYGKKNKIKEESYDVADGIAVGLHLALLLTKPKPIPKIRKAKIKNES